MSSATTTTPITLPQSTITTLMEAGRASLIDPAVAPYVSDPEGLGLPQLQDVRIRGRGISAGVGVGSQNWRPGETGWPWAVLTTVKKKIAYHTTGRAIEDWDAFLNIGLSDDANAANDLQGWAEAWDTYLTQWFAAHRRFGQSGFVAGDVYWQYDEADIRPFVDTSVYAFGLICRLHVHNEVLVTWGI